MQSGVPAAEPSFASRCQDPNTCQSNRFIPCRFESACMRLTPSRRSFVAGAGVAAAAALAGCSGDGGSEGESGTEGDNDTEQGNDGGETETVRIRGQHVVS